MARVACDIGACTHSADWAPLIAGMDAVVNCAGALPSAYHRLFGAWFACGFPAIASGAGDLPADADSPSALVGV